MKEIWVLLIADTPLAQAQVTRIFRIDGNCGSFRIARCVLRMLLAEACGGVFNLQLTVDDLELAVEI